MTESRIKNKELDITGHLLFEDNQFTQCFEGPVENVENLWASIQRDHRHFNVELLFNQIVSERKFKDWSMALTTYKSLLTDGLSGSFELDQNSFSNFTTHCFMD
jgi:hypothetical protein